jgi:hypothetical protein
MIILADIRISKLPFRFILEERHILYADGPILTHFYSDGDYLKYLLDFDENYNRYLIFKVSKKALYTYLSGGNSLRSIILELASDFAFIVDQDANDEYKYISLLYIYALPEEYLPDERSYYKLGIPSYYKQYLQDFDYIQYLRDRSFTFKLRPTDSEHGETVSSKEAGNFLINITKSMESYIDLTANNKLKATILDRTRLNKTINQLKAQTSPRIANSSYGSFEVSLAIDTIKLNNTGVLISDWKNEIIEGYKNDVLDVDFSNEEDANAIVYRFPDSESRKKIFEPFVRILDNRAIALSVHTYDKTFEKTYVKNRPVESFKYKVLPPTPIDDILKSEQKRLQIYTAVFKFPEGSNISSLKKSELMQNLLFTQEGTEQIVPISFEISYLGDMVKLDKPLECHLRVDSSGAVVLYNLKLDLNAEGDSMEKVIEIIKNQFQQILDDILKNPDVVDEKSAEIHRLVGL